MTDDIIIVSRDFLSLEGSGCGLLDKLSWNLIEPRATLNGEAGFPFRIPNGDYTNTDRKANELQ
jgi:hypothetical protein